MSNNSTSHHYLKEELRNKATDIYHPERLTFVVWGADEPEQPCDGGVVSGTTAEERGGEDCKNTKKQILLT